MTKTSDKKIARILVSDSGKTFAEEAGIDIRANTPSPLFQLLVASILFSARIRSQVAVAATRALFDHGWTTAEKMAGSCWEERTGVLNRSGYARYDERTSSMLGDTANFLLERYNGDLRRIREEAGRDPAKEQKLLTDFKGIGQVGANIFCREVQAAWEELFPFADEKALAAADNLGLPKDSKKLAGLVGKKDFPRLVAALIRVDLDDRKDEILEKAKS